MWNADVGAIRSAATLDSVTCAANASVVCGESRICFGTLTFLQRAMTDNVIASPAHGCAARKTSLICFAVSMHVSCPRQVLRTHTVTAALSTAHSVASPTGTFASRHNPASSGKNHGGACAFDNICASSIPVMIWLSGHAMMMSPSGDSSSTALPRAHVLHPYLPHFIEFIFASSSALNLSYESDCMHSAMTESDIAGDGVTSGILPNICVVGVKSHCSSPSHIFDRSCTVIFVFVYFMRPNVS